MRGGVESRAALMRFVREYLAMSLQGSPPIASGYLVQAISSCGELLMNNQISWRLRERDQGEHTQSDHQSHVPNEQREVVLERVVVEWECEGVTAID